MLPLRGGPKPRGPVDMRAEALGEFWDEAPVDIKEEEGITFDKAPAFP